MESYFLVKYDHESGWFVIDHDTQDSIMEHRAYDESRENDYSTEFGWFTPEVCSPEEVADQEAFVKLVNLLYNANKANRANIPTITGE